MRDCLLVLLFIFHNVRFARSGYPTLGDEVQAGSVLLPASRRGRYLANIVRRQAVDGTGIKFNKDADRMNAEAKKKVDVLSEELLPYIIAEQERRTTLYKRVMTAIQNGENGVTIAEIRNKPPAIIRKGLMYRCPTNRAPREPDGSGAIRCEANIDPTPIMYDSCLSAEDRDLYVAENKYFFCNRHRTEGADLPRNGTAVIGCAPSERTTLNYTSQKCALEDTDDVVVHYRYYPDKTYKFVSELDPDREVCEHWNPCQVSYIFSLPGPDQAAPAIELWHDYDDTDEAASSEDEIVPAIPEDDINETFTPGEKYTISKRRVRIHDGVTFHGVGKDMPSGTKIRISILDKMKDETSNARVAYKIIGEFVEVTLTFDPITPEDARSFYARFEHNNDPEKFDYATLVRLHAGRKRLTPQELVVMPGQLINTTRIEFACDKCVLHRIMLRVADGTVRNVNEHKYSVRRVVDDQGDELSAVDLELRVVTPRDLGDYFLMLQNEDGDEEQIKALVIKAHDGVSTDISVQPLMLSGTVHQVFQHSVPYDSPHGQLLDVLCRGESVLPQGKVQLKPSSVEFHFPSFEDSNACVYLGVFKIDDDTYKRELAIIDNDSSEVQLQPATPPAAEEGKPFAVSLQYTCREGCSVEQVSVDGIKLETTARRSNVGSVAYFMPLEKNELKIGITEYNPLYAGYFQAVFKTEHERFTKTLFALGVDANAAGGGDPTTPEEPDGNPPTDPVTDGKTDSTTASESTTDTSLTTTTEENNRRRRRLHEVLPAHVAAPERPSGPEPAAGGDARRSAGKPDTSIKVYPLRDSAQAKHRYEQKTIKYECPGGKLVAVQCRGRNVTAGLDVRDDNKVNIAFDPFEDANACVYTGLFKIGDTEHNKTLAVLDNNSPILEVTSAALPPPAAGELKHDVTYTCTAAKSCKPVEIYINDKVLKSTDTNAVFSVKSKEKVLPDGKEVTTITLHFSIKPFTKDYEGVYQLVASHGKERITKTIMEIG